jgi:N-acetylglucosaminyldiphosphoundecaprenol N-acetyl-beta-D-mannosaminyltransferase
MINKITKKNDETALLLGKRLFSKDMNALLEILNKKVIETKGFLSIFTPNPEQFVLSDNNQQFSNLLEKATILIPDGVGVVMASKILGKVHKTTTVTERITGVDLVQELLKIAQKKKWKILLLGGKGYDDNLHQIESIGLSREKKLSLLWNPGYRDISSPDKKEADKVLELIKKEKPNLIFVAFGAPWQEKWIIEHKVLLEKNGVKIAMAVGGTFDMLLGKVKRAPVIVRAIGLEWLYRLVQEPWRWRRQLKLVSFVVLVIKDAFRKRS